MIGIHAPRESASAARRWAWVCAFGAAFVLSCGDNRQPEDPDGGADAMEDGGDDGGNDGAGDGPTDGNNDGSDGGQDGGGDGGNDGATDGSGDGGADGGGDGAGDGAIDGTPDGPPPTVANIVISEVCLSPQHDFSGAVPSYLGPPGNGTISSNDEFVEIYNAGTDTVDLTNWILTIKDTEVKQTRLGIDGVMAFSSGSTLGAFLPGGYLVIGDPTGASSTDSYISLIDPWARVVDDVEIGGLTPSRDMEGDGVGDGAPNGTSNGFARGAFDEVIARPNGFADTGHDINDFEAMFATPGAANINPIFPPEAVAPVVVSHTSGSGRSVSTAITINFSEGVDPASIDAPGVIVVEVNNTPIALGPARFLNDDTTVVLVPIGVFPFGSTVDVSIAGGPGGVRDRVGNVMVASELFSITIESKPADPSSMMITEVRVSPVPDWRDSVGGNNVPFDDIPGTGLAGSDDEWIELVNLMPGVTNLNNYQLIVYTGPNLLQEARVVTRLSTSNARVIGSGILAASVAGDRIVVGNPVGALPVNIFLELRDANGILLDHVEIGGVFASTDRGGDGPNNGAPGVGKDGASSGLNDETISRVPDQADTGDDLADFASTAATIGAPN
ncbi:MAG: lamin tail domain-containing protein [Myxococcales bacterium]|nr:lamin tail domain-containing protein [Myxococcales bacterium]